MRRFLVALLLLGGCRQIFGIDDLPPAPLDDADVTPMYRVRLAHDVVLDDASGMPIHSVTELPDELRTVTIDGVTTVVDADGSATLPPGATHRIAFTAPTGPFEYQGPTGNLILPASQIGRLTTSPAPTGTVTVKVPTAASATLAALYTTGVFAYSPFVAVTNGAATVTAPLVPLFGLATTPDPQLGDQVHALAYGVVVGNNQANYNRLVREQTFASTLAGSPTLQITSAALVSDRCGSVHAEHALEVSRVQAAGYPTPVITPNWSVQATVAPELMYSGGPIIAGSGNTTVADVTESFAFANPLTGHESLLVMSAVGLHKIPLANGTVSTIDTVVGTLTWHDFDTSCDHTAVTELAAGGVGLPQRVSLAGSVLESDDTQVLLDPAADDVTIEWQHDDAPVDRYQIAVLEVLDGQASTLLRIGPNYLTRDARVLVPRSLFVTGHHYVLSIVAAHGLPGAADGDLATLSTAFALASFISPTFETAGGD